MGDLMTTKEACAYLRVSKVTLYAWARKRRVKRVKYGTRLVRWPRAQLDLMAQRETREMR